MFATLLLVAAVAPPPAKPSPVVIARWVEELGDDSFALREQASAKLRKAGSAAEPALLQALENNDAEIRNRARALLAEFKWGIYPDTPPAVVELIQSYRASARSERGAILGKLLDAGSAGCRAVIKIARAENDPDVRRIVFVQLTADLDRKATTLLAENNLPRLEALLELGLSSDSRSGILNYTAFAALRGELTARIADWEQQARQAVVPKFENEVLAYLYRAAGDLPKAVAAARIAENVPLLEALLYEAADWKRLAAERNVPTFTGEDTWLAYRTAYLRLGGSAQDYQKAIDELERRSRAMIRSSRLILPQAKALFLNGRADLALEILQKSNYSPRMTFEILSAQARIKEALEIAEQARKDDSPELSRVEILEARTLYLLGEKDRSLAILKNYADAVSPGPDEAWHQELVEAELALNRREQALTAAAKILAATGDRSRGERLFDKLFDPLGDETWALYQALRRHCPKDSIEETIKKIETLLDGKGEVKPIVETLRDTDAEVSSEDWWAVGEACVWCKEEKLATECFRMAGTSRSWIRLGDLLADKKEWTKASTHYQAAHSLAIKAAKPPLGEGSACLALWLAGHALNQAGQITEGKRKIDAAHLMPLGNGEMRFEFVRALRNRKHKEAERIEEQNLRRLCEPLLYEPDSYFTGEGLRAAAIEAADRKDWLRAADGYEQTFLRCLQPSMNFTRASAYATVPGHLFVTRARGLALAGRLDEALIETERALRSQPANVELAMHLVPELDRRDRKKEADDLYQRVHRIYAGVASDYPRCAWARNQLAWLSACCRRDLEDGLKRIREAIELSPDSASYHDTHAEVLFQMGKKEEAVAAQKKAISLQPKREDYKRRLKRIEAGDPNAPRIDDE